MSISLKVKDLVSPRIKAGVTALNSRHCGEVLLAQQMPTSINDVNKPRVYVTGILLQLYGNESEMKIAATAVF